ncbi:MAG: hypothetical protein AcusKO_42820 [Acuticoccus sp.]
MADRAGSVPDGLMDGRASGDESISDHGDRATRTVAALREPAASSLPAVFGMAGIVLLPELLDVLKSIGCELTVDPPETR